MQQSTANATASAFKKNSASFAPERWSGRLAPDELRRPGGMLIAALVQCAAERALTLTEMAQDMGVSYWDISQLRIGLRRLEALDDSLLAACSDFLGVPELTILMLAGLLAPQEALASADLTGVDLVYACLLAQTAPADVVLERLPNSSRALQGYSVDALADLQRQHGNQPAVQALLRAELRHRPQSKIELLRLALKALAPDQSGPPGAIMRCTGCQTRLRIPRLAAPGEICCPTCRVEYQVEWDDAVCLVQCLSSDHADEQPDQPPGPASGAGEEMTTAEAWALLGLEQGAPRSQVERARRSLLQHYHPDRLGHVSPLVRRLAEDAFKRVNQAYEQLQPLH